VVYGLVMNSLSSISWSITRFLDGPWDLRDFYHKQAFISKIDRPKWLPMRILDVRKAFGEWYTMKYLGKYTKGPRVGRFSRVHKYP
jgi:hypothetical protein